MDAGDKLAAATLAASRCAALGTHDVADYFAQYEAFERLFEARGTAALEADALQHGGNFDASMRAAGL